MNYNVYINYVLIASLLSMSIAREVFADSSKTTIIDTEKADEMVSFCDEPPIRYKKPWNPINNQIIYLEDNLFKKSSSSKTIKNLPKNFKLNDWYRQYAGIYYRGKKVIVARYTDWGDIGATDTWKTHPIIICDTYEGHFLFLYDVDKGEVLDTTLDDECRNRIDLRYKEAECLGIQSGP